MRYPGRKTDAVRDMDLGLRPEWRVALVGATDDIRTMITNAQLCNASLVVT